MHYVVVIEKEDGTTDYKAFRASADAIQRYNQASRAFLFREPIRVGNSEEMLILSCGMFRASAPDVRSAVQLVKDGKAEVLKPLGQPTLADLEP